MIIKKRNSVFETNSSSIHSLCVPTNKPYKVPDYVNFYLKHYGWGPDVETNPGNYLYTWLVLAGEKDRIKQLENILYKHGAVYVSFEPYKEKDKWDKFWIDHLDDARAWVDAVFKDEEKLLHDLFTPGAAIYITNDNTPDHEILEEIANALDRGEEEVFG